MLQKIKTSIGRFLLKREATTDRKRKGSNFNEARSIALVYLESDEAHFKKIKSFVKFLHDEYGIRKVMAFGYGEFDKKDVPRWLTHKLEFDYFTKEDLSWNLKPSQHILTFIEEPFDILIDTTNSDKVPLGYVVSQSKAHMKVGCNSAPGKENYDLMMNIDPFDFDKYLEQVNLYLSNMKIQ